MKYYRKYDDETLKKLQDELLQIFIKFDELCKKHDIKYFAIGGTLLGAIRHNGFIPWDDDLDIGMLRKEYERFLQIPAEELDDFRICSPETTPGHYYSFVTKFYRSKTQFISPINYEDGKMDMGLFIELFPYEDIDEKTLDKQIKKVNIIKNCYTTITCKKIIIFDQGIIGFIKRIVKVILKFFCILSKKDSRYFANKYLATINTDIISAKAYDFSDCGHLIDKEWVSDLSYKKFENTQILIPNNYDMVLKGLYGSDYMQIPKESERWNQAPMLIKFSDGTIVDYSSKKFDNLYKE